MIFFNDAFEQSFLKLMKEHIDEDLIIFEGLKNLPYFSHTYVNPFVVITLCKKGWIKGEYDMRQIEMHEGDLSVLLPNHLVSFKERSDDYDAMFILMVEDFAKTLREAKSLQMQLHFNDKVFVHLTQEEATIYLNMVNILRYIIRQNSEYKLELTRQQFNIIFHIVLNFEAFKHQERKERTRQEDICERFHDAVVKYHRQAREVIFYADKLCITPKYLSSIIKKVTGKSANDWINGYVIRESKAILRTNKHMTMQELSYHMGFPDQATFSKFFKKHTGYSPTEYRIK